MATTPDPTARAVVDTGTSYVDWSAIIAGAALATAISFVLITFGSGVGLSLVSAEPGEGVAFRWLILAGGLWFVWVAVSSFSAGGYLAGRLRRPIGDATPDEVETRDGAHGVLVWATGALIGAVLAAAGVTGIVGAASSTAGTAVGAAAEAIEGEVDYFARLLLRSDTGTVPDNLEARAQIATILQRGLTQGEVPSADRDYLVRVVATETGADPAAAKTQVDAALTQAETARQNAIDIAEQARVAGVITAFVIAATLLTSAAAAYVAATIGGEHRDQNRPFRTFGRSFTDTVRS